MDKDIRSIQEARDLVTKAHEAQKIFSKFSQAEVDRIVQAMAEAAFDASERLAKQAVTETRMGRYEDKITKNQFGSKHVYDFIKDMKTVGVIRHDEGRKIYEIASPMGVVCAVIPTTNPTSTTMYKLLISVKAGNSVVCAPHPRAVNCILETAELMRVGAESAGAPKNLISSMSVSTLEGTQELMKHKLTGVILATGGTGMVRAAYSSGKPAYGVGPGNVPAFIERTADPKKAVADVVAGKTFDYGVLCSSEQSIVCDLPLKDDVISELKANKCYILNPDEKQQLERYMFPGGRLNTEVVGQAAHLIASRAGLTVPMDTTALVVLLKSVGREDPLSAEKLSPVLGLYFENGWEAACNRCIEILNYGGIGHTMSIHSQDHDIIMKFGLEKPAFRIVVNTNSSIGAVGYTTGLAPSMTLGPGTLGGSITTDNIMPTNLINIKRLAFETKPYVAVWKRQASSQLPAEDQTKAAPAGGSNNVFDSRPGRIVPSAPADRKQTAEKLTDQEIDRIVLEFLRGSK